ncbi:MAG: hypothetical protein A2Z83_08375 [Omnitrophica bacterium GWA2_52_8]|nr:MAG: hypothetical protein A2Z83_08375 [Omnitrophica bacterium GWA2_52_8]
MKKLFRIIFYLFIGTAIAAAGLCLSRNLWLERVLEAYVNHTQQLFFADTLDISGVTLERSLHFKIPKVTGQYQTHEGPFAFEIHDIESVNSLADFLKGRALEILFGSLRPLGSELPGIAGRVVLKDPLAPVMEITGQFSGLDLKELEVLNPDNLAGASGFFTGHFVIKTNFAGKDTFWMTLKVTPPGGRLQSRFFDILAPFLPPAQARLLAAVDDLKLVGYREADLNIDLLEGEPALKIFLHILVPDYNLNLNLNLKVIVEDSKAFMQAAQLVGLVRIEAK